MENKIIPPTPCCCGFCGRTREQVHKLVRGRVGGFPSYICEKLILLLDWCVRWKFRRRKFIGLYRRFPNVVEVDEMVIKNTDAEAIVARERKLKNQRAYYATNKEQIRERCRKGPNLDHPNQHNYFWTDERQRWFLFEENLPTAEIARRMGLRKILSSPDSIDVTCRVAKDTRGQRRLNAYKC